MSGEVERLLAADPVEMAAKSFVAIVTWSQLGDSFTRQQIMKWLTQEFGKPRWNDQLALKAYNAVIFELELIYEQARIAARRSDGSVTILPRGVRLRDAPDPVTALRELL
ncbi:hypothetical protein E1263_17255 [Kribbella antibiotica]|uniref:Uncharacterized protein n=1 Tax=Kribbella antibiotica TaxID=190195 RepID=A0A4R4ZL48_9ACTN|nr:hypothetical protein [Kribbella antibiotica]TDD58930.1 hypothetical protein E1263_17255 [Kribbella antibiotica]